MTTLFQRDFDKVPEPTLRRLPWYLSTIKLLREKGEHYVSSTQISKDINVDASQIAKDLSYVKVSGRTRVGYEIDGLIAALEAFLGFTDMHRAFLFGAGSLGRALLGDSGLHQFGLEIVAAVRRSLPSFPEKKDRSGRSAYLPHAGLRAEDERVSSEHWHSDGAYQHRPAGDRRDDSRRYPRRVEFYAFPHPRAGAYRRAEHVALCPPGGHVQPIEL